jgi:uncharacterized membrane protein (DUF485 family)
MAVRPDAVDRSTAPVAGAHDAAERQETPDWVAIERSPAFRELVNRRRRFIIPATIGFLAWYLGFIALCGWAPDFMGESIYEGFTVGYLLALTQFVMVWVLGALYLRRSNREFDPLAEKAIEDTAPATHAVEREEHPIRPGRPARTVDDGAATVSPTPGKEARS